MSRKQSVAKAQRSDVETSAALAARNAAIAAAAELERTGKASAAPVSVLVSAPSVSYGKKDFDGFIERVIDTMSMRNDVAVKKVARIGKDDAYIVIVPFLDMSIQLKVTNEAVFNNRVTEIGAGGGKGGNLSCEETVEKFSFVSRPWSVFAGGPIIPDLGEKCNSREPEDRMNDALAYITGILDSLYSDLDMEISEIAEHTKKLIDAYKYAGVASPEHIQSLRIAIFCEKLIRETQSAEIRELLHGGKTGDIAVAENDALEAYLSDHGHVGTGDGDVGAAKTASAEAERKINAVLHVYGLRYAAGTSVSFSSAYNRYAAQVGGMAVTRGLFKSNVSSVTTITKTRGTHIINNATTAAFDT